MPWLLASVAALAAAIAFAAGLGVPRHRPTGLRGVIVRWGHSAVWVLLAGTFAALAISRGELASALGLLALGSYGVFLGTTLSVRRDAGDG